MRGLGAKVVNALAFKPEPKFAGVRQSDFLVHLDLSAIFFRTASSSAAVSID
jgi:hypothetical protein